MLASDTRQALATVKTPAVASFVVKCCRSSWVFPTRYDATFRTRVVDRVVGVVHYGAAALVYASP